VSRFETSRISEPFFAGSLEAQAAPDSTMIPLWISSFLEYRVIFTAARCRTSFGGIWSFWVNFMGFPTTTSRFSAKY
jgi:hypothetical protein